MIIILILALCELNFAAFPASTQPNLAPQHKNISSTIPDIFCYTSSYASQAPILKDCAEILNHQLATPHMTALLHFSHHPTGSEFGLPHVWNTERLGCAVVIDVPEVAHLPTVPAAAASMLDIKRAAFAVLVKCVRDGDHLGGIVQAGLGGNLQVRVEAIEVSLEPAHSEVA